MRSNRNNTARRGIGFTLVEMLIVVGIIALLASIMMPSIYKARQQAKLWTSRATIQTLDGACRYFYNDFEGNYDANNKWQAYPASAGDGYHLLVQQLTGVGHPNKPANRPFGFQLVPKGKIYGPYGGAENVRMGPLKPPRPGDSASFQTGDPFFVDAFGNPIYYYRFDRGASPPRYQDGDNPAAAKFAYGNTLPITIDTYAKNGSGTYYRTDFILCSPGANGEWNPPGSGPSDDATNFFNQ